MIGILLAAGRGTRMKSDTPKVLFEINDEPMCFGPYRALFETCDRVAVVVGYRGADVKDTLLTRAFEAFGEDKVRAKTLFFTQEVQRGTGDAVRVALDGLIKGGATDEGTIVLNGDLPLIRKETIEDMIKQVKEARLSGACLSYEARNPHGLGRILRDDMGNFAKIQEEKDASADERLQKEVNGGVYYFRTEMLVEALRGLKSENKQGEFYLTDVLLPRGNTLRTDALPVREPEDLLGVNSTWELALVRAKAQERLQQWVCEEKGVELLDHRSVFISSRAQFKGPCKIGPNTVIKGLSSIGAGAVIQGGAYLVDATVGEDSEILWGSVIVSSNVGPEAKVGPMAHLRPGSELGTGVKVGNFVEIKKSVLGPNCKVSHLSYIGDAEIGEGSNIGAGTITCNFDGFNKYKTKIGKRSFVGSDTQLVAPITIGDDAYVGSGTTVTQDVPSGALAISRPDMVIKEGYAQKLAAKRKQSDK
jgi:bifunctional UDP-N-acetylglucosamine pyrophosphorylase/glucosamine-1-phosphate N-acetyltransferase